MTDFLLELVSAAEKNAFPTLSQLSVNDVDRIWSNVSSFIEKQMSLLKGIRICGFGTFTFSQQKLDIGNKYVLIQRPIFRLSEKLACLYGLKQVKLLASGEVPVVPLNYVALAVKSAFDRDQVEGCVRETLLLLLRAVASQRTVLFTFQGVGVLSIQLRKVKMKFNRDFITAMDRSGQLVWAMSNRPGTSISLVSGRLSGQQRPGTSNAVLLPRVSSVDEGNEEGEEDSCTLPNAVGRREETREGGSTEGEAGQRPMTRPTLQLAKVNELYITTDLDTVPPLTPMDRAAVASKPPVGVATDLKEIRGDTQSNLCTDHSRAGQELCYLCMQRAQRNVPLYLAEERLRANQEKERVLLLHEEQRDQAYLQREQVNREQIRENNQKIAAFNLGMAEAMKKRKATRSPQFHSSYVLGGRPDTPSSLPRQMDYMRELVAQAEQRRDREARSQQNQNLFDRLQQFHLADEIRKQRLLQLQQKAEDAMSYQKALDTQVRERATGVPARLPDSNGPVFGLHDCLPQALIEQKQRAQKLYQEQLQTAKDRQKEVLFNKIMEQKKERDQFKKNSKELMEDRMICHEKKRSLRASLEDTWSRSMEQKRHKDQEEKSFRRSNSHLLMDQCEQYRRCFQCKRRTSNSGATNIWKESRYIPGTRLMV